MTSTDKILDVPHTETLARIISCEQYKITVNNFFHIFILIYLKKIVNIYPLPQPWLIKPTGPRVQEITLEISECLYQSFSFTKAYQTLFVRVVSLTLGLPLNRNKFFHSLNEYNDMIENRHLSQKIHYITLF